MADGDKKISELTSAIVVNNSDVIPIYQVGASDTLGATISALHTNFESHFLPLTGGTLTGDLNIGEDNTEDHFLTFSSLDANDARWNFVTTHATFLGVTDEVLFIGWNKGPVGVPNVVAGEPSLYIGMEANYQADPVQALMEWYVEFNDAAGGNIRRPYAMAVDRNTFVVANRVTGTTRFYDSTGLVQTFTMTDGGGLVSYGQSIFNVTNNARFLTQHNAAVDTIVDVVKLNASDYVEIGGADENYPASAGAFVMKLVNAAPAAPVEGMIAFADGVGWNPGAGRGLYEYSLGAWVKL